VAFWATWRYPDLTAHAEYLAKIIDTTLTQEMRSIRQNGNTLSNQLCKQYPILTEKPVIAERVVHAVQEAFAD